LIGDILSWVEFAPDEIVHEIGGSGHPVWLSCPSDAENNHGTHYADQGTKAKALKHNHITHDNTKQHDEV
jgi:hypothetical protein